MKTVAGIVLVLLLVAVVWYMRLPGGMLSRPTAASSEAAKPIVARLCEQEMRGRLHSPESAMFPDEHAARVEAVADSARRYILRSHVDAATSSAALLRTLFTCVVDGEGEDSSGYSVVSLSAVPD
jgi:hypothetical protein